MRDHRVSEGRPNPLGVTLDAEGANFALFSAHADKVEVCLFDPQDGRETDRITLPEYSDEVFHGHIAGIREGTLYGYRVHGSYSPREGLRFNPNKLLLDPYARAHRGELQWRPEIFGYKLGARTRDLTFDTRDSAPFVPKCVVMPNPPQRTDRPPKPRTPWERTVLYEMSVRGFTRRHPAVPEAERGTFSGIGNPAVIEYLKTLGVSAVEWLPIHAWVDDSYLLEKGLRNYWGYNSIGFFAADPRLFVPDRWLDLADIVDDYHRAGLEVILDVVYNHTAEGNELGPTLSFRGIDNLSYYKLVPDKPRHYINDTGTGNTVDLTHPRVLQMVADSLRYWAEVIGVDGFRFDLATILCRLDTGFSESSGFLQTCLQDPTLAEAKLIAEPWDCGPGGYQVGQFLPGWGEWNDRFRDCTRAFWKGDDGAVRALAARITGSADLFDRRGRKPWASVNFVTAHDGFTLNDLVSYNDKHNEANGEDNRDGHSHNLSWNHGHEGPTDDPAIVELRERQKRNILATLLFAQGTPMITAGDEFGRTQGGNNNAYCQDNEISWIDWALPEAEPGAALLAFTRRLLEIRRSLPLLHRGRFLGTAYDAERDLSELRWVSPAGVELTPEQWNDDHMRCLGLVIDGRAQESNIPRPGADATLLWVLNAYHDAVEFHLPEAAGGSHWCCLLDTNNPVPDTLPVLGVGEAYLVTGRSTLLFALEANGDTGRVLGELKEGLLHADA